MPISTLNLILDALQAVASTALALAALLNAPPGFLEFIICIPWRRLAELYPRPLAMEQLIGTLDVPAEEKRRMVNRPVHARLTPTLLDFIFNGGHGAGLPPMFAVRTLALLILFGMFKSFK